MLGPSHPDTYLILSYLSALDVQGGISGRHHLLPPGRVLSLAGLRARPAE